MPQGYATFSFAGGSVLSTRQVPEEEKREMRKQRQKIWKCFDKTHATRYDAAEAPVLLPLARRPVFMLLVAAMTGAKFGSDADEKDWNMYDFDEDFERGGEVELANVVGAFLHPRTLRSDVLDRFYSATQQTSDALFDSLADLLFDSMSPAVNIIISAIYCYWRFERELLHPGFQRQLSLWQGDEIRGGLLEIARKWNDRRGGRTAAGSVHYTCISLDTKQAIAGVFEKMTVQIEAANAAKAQTLI